MRNASTADRTLGFQIHAFVFATTMALLFAINLLTGGPLWSIWVLLSWGVGIGAHGVFGRGGNPVKLSN